MGLKKILTKCENSWLLLIKYMRWCIVMVKIFKVGLLDLTNKNTRYIFKCEL